MKFVKSIFAATALLFATGVYAQLYMPVARKVTSPQINPNGSVTFRLYAPDAKKVQLRGDFLLRESKTSYGHAENPVNSDMKKLPDGVWEFTVDNVAPEMYSYIFIVDGLNMSDPSNEYNTRENGIITSRFIMSKSNDDVGSLYKVHDVPHGTVAKVWYPSAKQNGTLRRATVYTPPGYSATSGKRYPVMYLCHGGGQDEEKWQVEGRACQILDNLIARGKAEPMIVVMPNGNSNRQAAPNEAPVDSKASAFPIRVTKDANPLIFPDLIAFIDANYATVAEKYGRAMCGLSMGGYQTFYFTMEHPELIGYIGLFSPGALPDWGDPTPAVEQYRKNPEIMSGLKKVFAAEPALYWVGIGELDPHKADIVGLKELLTENKYEFSYMESPGAHEWKAWRIHLTDFASKIFKKHK